MIGVVKRSFVSTHFPSLLALVIKYTQRPSGPQKIVSVKIDLCQGIYVYKDKWVDCWEWRRRSFLVKNWWLEAFMWKQNWDSSYSLWEHRLVVVFILWRCPEDKKRHLGMGVFLVRQVLEKGDGRKWTELSHMHQRLDLCSNSAGRIPETCNSTPRSRRQELAWWAAALKTGMGELCCRIFSGFVTSQPASLCRRDASWDPSSGYYKS